MPAQLFTAIKQCAPPLRSLLTAGTPVRHEQSATHTAGVVQGDLVYKYVQLGFSWLQWSRIAKQEWKRLEAVTFIRRLPVP